MSDINWIEEHANRMRDAQENAEDYMKLLIQNQGMMARDFSLLAQGLVLINSNIMNVNQLLFQLIIETRDTRGELVKSRAAGFSPGYEKFDNMITQLIGLRQDIERSVDYLARKIR